MIKPLKTTSLTYLVGGGGDYGRDVATETLPDDPIRNGSDAVKSILSGETTNMRFRGELDGVTAFGEFLIPYHSTVQATVEHSSVEAEDPVDDLCKQEESVPTSVIGCWLLNETPTATQIAVTADFTSNGQTWKALDVNLYGDSITLNYWADFLHGDEGQMAFGTPFGETQASWRNEAYRNVCFTSGESEELLAWLIENGEKVS